MDFAPATPSIATPIHAPQGAPETPRANGRPRQARVLLGECKTCTGCSLSKDLSEFPIKRGGRATRCLTCQKAASDAHYQRNREGRIADARVRNEHTRMTLAAVRDTYLANCLCENCTGTVDLQLTTRVRYDGESAHEIVGGAGSLERLKVAMGNSRVLCKPCMGGTYGKAGVPQRNAVRKLAKAPALEVWTSQEAGELAIA